MRTRYDDHNGDFSSRAHEAARRWIYPLLFDAAPELLSYEDYTAWDKESVRQVDGQLGIDRVVGVQAPGLSAPVRFTVQERFRRASYSAYRDITITEHNHNTGRPSELHKIAAGMMLYACYDEAADCFLRPIAINVPSLLLAVACNTISYTRNSNNKGQSFLIFGYEQLYEAGCVIWAAERAGADMRAAATM